MARKMKLLVYLDELGRTRTKLIPVDVVADYTVIKAEYVNSNCKKKKGKSERK